MAWNLVGSIRGPAGDLPLGAHNLKPTNMRRSAAGLARAAGGGKFHALVIGDSTGIGYNGTTTIESISFPRRAAQHIASALGVPLAGSGIVPAIVGQGVMSDRWVPTGSTDASIYTGLLTMYTGSSITYSSVIAGTEIDLFYSEQSTSGFTVSIDGATATPVTTNGSGDIGKVTYSGLANRPHTIRVNCTGTFAFVYGVEVRAPAGVAVHNLAYGGSTANFGGPTKSWLDPASPGLNLNFARREMFEVSGNVPDLVVCVLGANDIFLGDTTANAIEGIETIRGWYPDADFLMCGSWEVPTTNAGQWAAYRAAKYALADELDVPFLDWTTRTGLVAEAVTLGLVGADGIHANTGQNLEYGRTLAEAIGASATPRDKTPALMTTAPFSEAGVLTVKVGSGRYPIVGDWEIVWVAATAGTAPTGSAVVVDVNKNGTTIYPTQANRPSIAASAHAATVGAHATTYLTTGDYLTVDIDAIGSTVAGAALSVLVGLRSLG